jgi:uncharacterized protein (DUF362 family)
MVAAPFGWTRVIDRRSFLLGGTTMAITAASAACSPAPRQWQPAAYRKPTESRVAILEARRYDASLYDVVLKGLRLFGIGVAGKTVVLKPNLVEYDPAGVINTHPAVIAAAVAAFRGLGARRVVVAEGPGHRRDNEYLLTASGLYDVLAEYDAPYVDLNTDDVRRLPLQSHFTQLGELYFPETVVTADLLVSMPKLKTHHWAGATLSLKNMFGLIPGAFYGWPKNILHRAGIHESIVDINSTIPVPTFAIVDGVVGMEGNGPIQGTAKHCGVLLFGDDLVAVDATAARLMSLNPSKIPYLDRAGQFLGNLAEVRIRHVGEQPDRFRQDFRVIKSFQELKT